MLVSNCPGDKLSGDKLSGCQIVRFLTLGAKLSGCRIIRCQIVRCQIVRCQIVLPPKICPRYAQDMTRYPQDMPKICPRYAEYPLALLRQSESNIWQWLTKSQKHHSATHWLSNMDPRNASASKKICGPKMIAWSPVLHLSLDDLV